MQPVPASPQQPHINLAGEKVAIGPMRKEYVPLYERWLTDFEVTRTLLFIRPMTREAEEAWYESGQKRENTVFFTIFLRDGLCPIGNAGLHDIDHKDGTAEFGILIGEKDCWGHGYGSEATRLVLDYGFNVLALHNIMLRVYAFHERGLRCYRRAGFREIGRRREARRLAGQMFDVVMMDCLAREFTSPAVHKLFPPTSVAPQALQERAPDTPIATPETRRRA